MGFPTRISRDAFGPIPEDTKPVVNPKRQLSAGIGNLMMWQIAGSGLMVPTARMIFTVAAGVLTLAQHTEAFQPNAGAAPNTARTGAGVYTFSFLANYPDEEGIARPLVFNWGEVRCEGSAFRTGLVELNPDLRSGTARIWSDAGVTAADCAKFSVVLG